MKIYSLLLLVLICGCATGYHTNSLDGGYRDTQYAPDVFRVTFRGNGYTSMERAQDYTLLRCAVVTLKSGYNYFAIADESHTVTPVTISTPASSYTTSSGNAYITGNFYSYDSFQASFDATTHYNGNSSTVYYPGQTFTLYKPHTSMLIKCFTSQPAGIYTFDAEFLRTHLSQEYHIHLSPTRNYEISWQDATNDNFLKTHISWPATITITNSPSDLHPGPLTDADVGITNSISTTNAP